MEKIITSMPISEIHDIPTNLIYHKVKHIDSQYIIDLIKKEKVKFVIANVGETLKWIDIENCYKFWKNEVKNHLANDLNKIDIEQFENNYCYIASEFETASNDYLILLEKFH